MTNARFLAERILLIASRRLDRCHSLLGRERRDVDRLTEKPDLNTPVMGHHGIRLPLVFRHGRFVNHDAGHAIHTAANVPAICRRRFLF